MTWLLLLGLVPCSLVVAAVGISAYGSKRWADVTLRLSQELDAARIDTWVNPALPTRYDSRELEGLHAPVSRYFRVVLKEGQPIIAAATVELAGTFNMSATDEQLKPFTSRQRVELRHPRLDCQPVFPGGRFTDAREPRRPEKGRVSVGAFCEHGP